MFQSYGAALLVSGLLGAQQISSGDGYSCAVVNGIAKCWGRNDNGQLGGGSNEDRSTPTQVQDLESGVTAISAGAAHTCAVHGGEVRCWGHNAYGEMGAAGISASTRAVVLLISANSGSTCAVHDGAVKCWGNNYYGQLGDGTHGSADDPRSANKNTPVRVLGL